MNLISLHKRFESKAVIRGGIYLLSPEDAIDFINECKLNDINVLGAEAFRIFPNTIQPSMEHSIDLNGSSNGSHEAVSDFIRQRRQLGFWFEVGATENETE